MTYYNPLLSEQIALWSPHTGIYENTDLRDINPMTHSEKPSVPNFIKFYQPPFISCTQSK